MYLKRVLPTALSPSLLLFLLSFLLSSHLPHLLSSSLLIQNLPSPFYFTHAHTLLSSSLLLIYLCTLTSLLHIPVVAGFVQYGVARFMSYVVTRVMSFVCQRPGFSSSLKKNRNKKVMVFFSSCKSVKFHCELLNYIDTTVLDIHVSLDHPES